jgi:fluoroacetyl-CoA thioesterase
MNPDRIVGTEAEFTATVTEDMCPAWDGVVVHPVYSTWSMAHHMELAARGVLLPHLDPGEEGLGSRLEIEHIAPLPVGRRARAVARCVEADAKSVVCEVTSHDHETGRLLGRGRHVQRILRKRTLKALIERYR